MVFIYVLFKKGKFYTRESFLAFCLKIAGKDVTWESHEGQKNIFAKVFIKLGGRMVVITKSLKDLYLSSGVKESNIVVVPDAVDIEIFNISHTRDEAREKLGLDKHNKIAMYVGSNNQAWKGVDVLREAGGALPDGVQVLVVSDKRHEEVPLYLRSADVVVLPNSAKSDVSKFYTSPMKLFEYMASGVPIVASSLPSIREIIDDSMAYFFEPDDSKSLSDAIQLSLTDDASMEKSKKAQLEVGKYTWEKRAEDIIRFIT